MTAWTTGETATMAWLSHRELVALGWTLLHFLWQGAAIAILYSVLNRLTLQARPALRYGVALGALALMPLSVAVTFALEMQAAEIHPFEMRPRQTRAATPDLPQNYAQAVFRDTVLPRLPASLASIAKEPASTFLNASAETLLPWVDAIWILGVLLLATRAFGGWLRLQQIRRNTHSILPAPVERSFERIKRQLAIHRQVLLRVSDQVISPFAMGLWRATVIVPASTLLRLSPEELEAVFAHELGHIRRFDYLCNLVQIAIESALFFHPAVWWLSRTVRDRREVCCDAIAVATCADAIVYARALLYIEEQRTMQLEQAMALKGRPGTLRQRIQQILGEENTMGNGMNNGVRIAVAGAVVFGLLLAPKISTAVAASHIAPAQTSDIQAPSKDAQPAPHPKPSPLVFAASPAPEPNPAPSANPKGTPVAALHFFTPEASPMLFAPLQKSEEKPSGNGPSYIDGMRAAGYPLDLNNDLDSLISLRSVGVTPEYAKAMAEVGMGKPSVHDLISLKSMDITPDYVAGFKNSGIEPKNFHELISIKSVGVTPEYAKAMAEVGMGKPSDNDLISLKSMGVTPEYVAGLKRSGIEPKNFHEVVSEKALGVTPEYAAAMKQSGFGDLDLQGLISLKAQGITPEYATWLRKQFPQASMEDLRRAAVFHIDQAFVDKAKSHGMDGSNLDKMTRLKMSGLLDE